MLEVSLGGHPYFSLSCQRVEMGCTGRRMRINSFFQCSVWVSHLLCMDGVQKPLPHPTFERVCMPFVYVCGHAGVRVCVRVCVSARCFGAGMIAKV